MTIIGIDDTDDRTAGMCTTYVGSHIADACKAAGGRVDRCLLIRLSPAAPHKTRGNAAVAIHTDLDTEDAVSVATPVVESLAVIDGGHAQPGLVVADSITAPVSTFSRRAVREVVPRSAADDLLDQTDADVRTWNGGRGVIGALAAIGAWYGLDEWTYESISYRTRDRWGSDRSVGAESVRAAADDGYPVIWDTIDGVTGDLVCIPRTPCPVLFGIRGDDPDTVRTTADAIQSEPVASRRLFVTNQGTDGHLHDARLASIADGQAVRVQATVAAPPETGPGGHVHLQLEDEDTRGRAVAFEPTKHFRAVVRALRPGDEIIACGEVGQGTIKLEKLAVRSLVTHTERNPTCPSCGNSMASAGRNQGYRCRSCQTTAHDLERVALDRDIDLGWYEVPPCARRHLAKPLIRGGFDGPVHPQR